VTRKGSGTRSDSSATFEGALESRVPYSSFAVAAMVTAACSILCPPLGVIGLLLGGVALFDLRRTGRTRRGRSFAMIGVVIGGLTTGLSLGVGLWFLQRSAQSLQAGATLTDRATEANLPLVAEREVVPAASHRPEPDTIEHERGRTTVVDVGPRVRSLVETLDEQRQQARASKERLIVWVVVPDCEPCRRVDEALEDPKLQRALDGARLVRLDATKFAVELSHLGAPVDSFPGFALLGDDGQIVDYIHGGEWDADIADNIAPVLESFVGGTYRERRHPWRGGGHDDEIAI
jgi:hypothetical protein